MLIAEKVSLNSQVYGGSFSLKNYLMERDLYKQIKLVKKQYLFKLKAVRKERNFKATANFFNYLSYKKKKRKEKLR